MTQYRISQLAEISGVPATTLRFYDSAGLLPAERTQSGYRVYDERAVERLTFIAAAKLLGLPLEEISEVLAVWEDGVCASVRDRLLPLVAERLRETERRVADLTAFAGHLAKVKEELAGPAPSGACGPGCGCTPATAGPVDIELFRALPTTADELADTPPIACTLNRAGQVAQGAAWQAALALATDRADVAGGLQVTFPSDGPAAAEALRLAVVESACCPFLDITLRPVPGGVVLTVCAPEGARGIVLDLFGNRA